jgi:TATA-binding protein-associated factor
VSRFNGDSTIDILLLTTAVGGQGLTLTGADTVIFVECDWNPTKDLQAMDRAHRLGQKRTVQVFRLITKDTIEEKLLGLQQFKLTMAGMIVTQQNNKLANMSTNALMEMLTEKSVEIEDE